MRTLQKTPPVLTQYITIEDSSRSPTPAETIELGDYIIEATIAASNIYSSIHKFAAQGNTEIIPTFLKEFNKQAREKSVLFHAAACCYIDKIQWAQLQNVRDRIDQLAGDDDEKRQQIVELFEKHLTNKGMTHHVTMNVFDEFIELMNDAESEIKNLNL